MQHQLDHIGRLLSIKQDLTCERNVWLSWVLKKRANKSRKRSQYCFIMVAVSTGLKLPNRSIDCWYKLSTLSVILENTCLVQGLLAAQEHRLVALDAESSVPREVARYNRELCAKADSTCAVAGN